MIFSQLVGISRATGVTAPIPVMTTRLFGMYPHNNFRF